MDIIKIGTRFFDDREGRYIIPDGIGTDPNVFSCIVEEMDDNGDYQIVGRQLFTRYELKHFKEVDAE